jgi:hypothetical protein
MPLALKVVSDVPLVNEAGEVSVPMRVLGLKSPFV